jgi:hypothetical protein
MTTAARRPSTIVPNTKSTFRMLANAKYELMFLEKAPINAVDDGDNKSRDDEAADH